MTLVSGHNYKVHAELRIFAEVCLGARVKRRWGLSMTAFLGDLGGYVSENFRDTASNIISRYATPYRPVTDCEMNDLE